MEKVISKAKLNIGITSRISKIFTLCILLCPVLSIYASPIPSVSIAEIALAFCILIMLYLMFKYNIKIKKSPFFIYLGYAGFSTILISLYFLISYNGFVMGDMFRRIVRDGFYFAVIVIFAPSFFEFEFGKSVIRKISILLCFYIILQFTVFALFKVYVPGIIPSAKTTISNGAIGKEIIDHFAHDALLDGYARGSGFFSEPAVVAHFLTVALLLEMFSGKKRKKTMLMLLYSAAMLLTVSVNAYVALVVCWIMFFLYNNRRNSAKLLLAVLCSIFALYIAVVIAKAAGLSVFERISELINGDNVTGSSVIRVLRGFAFFNQMPLFHKIFGSGFGNFLQFKNIFGISTVYETLDEYMNTNAYILVSSGVLGFGLFVITLFKHVKHKIPFSKAMLIIILMFGLSSSIYSTGQFIIMMVFMLNAPYKGREKT